MVKASSLFSSRLFGFDSASGEMAVMGCEVSVILMDTFPMQPIEAKLQLGVVEELTNTRGLLQFEVNFAGNI